MYQKGEKKSRCLLATSLYQMKYNLTFVSIIPNKKCKCLFIVYYSGYAFSKQALILHLTKIKHWARFDSCAGCF